MACREAGGVAAAEINLSSQDAVEHAVMPLALAEAPQEWRGLEDDAPVDDFGFSTGYTSDKGWTARYQQD